MLKYAELLAPKSIMMQKPARSNGSVAGRNRLVTRSTLFTGKDIRDAVKEPLLRAGFCIDALTIAHLFDHRFDLGF